MTSMHGNVCAVRGGATRRRPQGEELLAKVSPFGSKDLARWVVVPPVPMRHRIVADTHAATGHCGVKKLAEAVL